MGPVDAVLLVLFGILLIFAGRTMVRILASLIFGGFIGLLGFGFVISAGGGVILGFIIGILLFVLGLIIGFIVFKIGLSITAGYIIASLALAVLVEKHLVSIHGYEKLALFVLTVLAAVIVYIIFDYVLALGIAVVASTLVFQGLTYWFSRTVSLIIALIVLVVGAVYQWKKIRYERREELE